MNRIFKLVLCFIFTFSCLNFIACGGDKSSNSNKEYNLKYDGTIDFGSYPQAEVTDSGLVSSLTSLAGTKPTSSNSGTWTSYKYYIEGIKKDFMWYKDISYNGNKYRAIYFTSYRPSSISYSSSTDNSYQDDNGYYTNTLYFFKFNPINWRILTQRNGKALLMCNKAIDSQEFDDSSRDYYNSNIYDWLNNNFYNTAFNESEKKIVKNVFLLSTTDVSNKDYGFYLDYYVSGNRCWERCMKGTSYAKSQGLYYFKYSYTKNDYCTWYCQGISGIFEPKSDFAIAIVDKDGYLTNDGSCRDASNGVVPAMWIKL